MGFLRFFDETVNYFISDIRKQTGKGFFETFTDKGNYGEFLSYKYLINTPGKRDYIHNCYVPTDSGYTEIDFILLHETGIYVVESKNFSGWIFGGEQSKYWTQVMAGGKTKNRFFNPVLQNAGHIKALKSFLKDFPDLRFYSLIVFSERCELKKVSCNLPDTYIVKRDALKSVFKHQIKERDKIPEKILYEIGCLLKPHCHMTAEEKAGHIERINGMKTSGSIAARESIAQIQSVMPNIEVPDDEAPLVIDEVTAAEILASERPDSNTIEIPDTDANERLEPDATERAKPNAIERLVSVATDTGMPGGESDASAMTCPCCQRPLVERKGKNGSFIGCTGYPQCRYTRNLE